MFAKTRLALMIGITGGMNVSVLAQETSTTHDTVVVTSQMQNGDRKSVV